MAFMSLRRVSEPSLFSPGVHNTCLHARQQSRVQRLFGVLSVLGGLREAHSSSSIATADCTSAAEA
jgi:hypothetical protein